MNNNMVIFLVILAFFLIGISVVARVAIWKAKKDHEEFIRPYKKYERK